MGDEENLLNNKNSGDPLKNSQETSSVSHKASLLEDPEPYSDADMSEDDGVKKFSRFVCFNIIIFIYSALFACTIGLLITSLTVDKLKNYLIWDFKLWKWCLILAIIICGGLGIFLLIEAVQWLIIKIWHNEIVVYYFVGVKKSMVVFVWVTLIFISWFLLLDRETKLSKDTNKIVSDINRGLGGCVIGVAIWLVKTGLVKLVGSFHVKILFDKFKSINNRGKILKSLSEKANELEFFAEMAKELESLLDKEMKKTLLSYLVQKNRKPLSKKEMKNLKDLFEKKKNEPLSEEEQEHLKFLWRRKKKKNRYYLLEEQKKKNTDDMIDVIKNKQLPPLHIKCGNKHKEIKDENEAKSTANEIFKSFAFADDGRIAYLEIILEFLDDDEERKHFIAAGRKKKRVSDMKISDDGRTAVLKTLLEFLNDEEEQQHFIAVAERNQKSVSDIQEDSKDIQKDVPRDEHDDCKDTKKSVLEEQQIIERSIFRNWVVDIFRQYESANNALKNRKSAVDELNMLASVVVLIVIIIVWLIFMELLSSRTLFFICSQLILAAFIFGNTAKSIFEAIIFVFVMHPFDVGDRCIVDDVEVTVDEMEIMSTTFLKYDNARIYYPNSVLATKPITNLYRSPPMLDTFEFTIDLSKSKLKDNFEKLQGKLERKIAKYIESSPRRWGDHSVQFKEIEDKDKLKVALYVHHKINFHDAPRRSKRRAKLIIGMKKIFKELKLTCTKFKIRDKAGPELNK